jgi:hypothetical protein
MRISKECTTQISPILTTLFSLSLKTGNIPDDWRYASVCPAFKKVIKTSLHIIFSMYCQYAVLCSFGMFAFICLSLESFHLPLRLCFLYFFLYFDIFVFISLVIHGRFFRCLHSDTKTKANILNEQFQKAFTPANDDPVPKQSRHPQMPDIIITENGINKLLQNINIHKASGPDNIEFHVFSFVY